MKNDPAQDRFRELFWRRERTDAEQARLHAWLMAHPDSQTEAETEDQLNSLLNTLPKAPVSSNFTARVLDAVERETRVQSPSPVAAWSVDWLWRSLVPRVAVVAAVTAIGFYAWHRYEVVQRTEIAQSLMAVSEIESLPPAAFLEDFETIRRMGRQPAVDEELLALMQ